MSHFLPRVTYGSGTVNETSRARPAARQIVDPARLRDADSGGIEHQQFRVRARRDAAALGDTVEPGLVAGQAPHAFGQAEGAALANPVPEEVEAEPRIAKVHEMRTGVGQRDDPSVVLD